MTRLVGTFSAGFALTLAIALATSIKGAWLLFVYGFVQACIGAGVCYKTIHSHWGCVEGVKTSAEGYIAPAIVAFLNLLVLFCKLERSIQNMIFSRPFWTILNLRGGRCHNQVDF